jgi:hypothetical protein
MIGPQLKKRPTESSDVISNQWTSNPFLVGYFAEAERLSEQCQELNRLLIEAQTITRTGIQPQSPRAYDLAERLAKICRKHDLGDPLTYAQWAALARPPPQEITREEDQATWAFMAAAVLAHKPPRSWRRASAQSARQSLPTRE